jgi:O-antigen ligase
LILRRTTSLWPLLAALATAAAWPFTAYLIHPAVLPLLLAGGLAGAVILQQPEWGVAAILALVPLTNVAVGDVKPLHVVLPALTGAVLLHTLFVARDSTAKPADSWLMLAVALFCGAAIVSSMFALDAGESVNPLFVVLTAVAVFFSVLQIGDASRRLEVIVVGLLLALLVATVHGIAQQVFDAYGPSGGVLIDGEVVSRVQGAFGHPNQYANFLAVLMPLAGAVALTRSAPPRLRFLGAGAFLLAVQPLIFSFTRGAIVALVIGSLLWLAIVRPRTAVLVAAVVAVAGFSLAPQALRERLQSEGTAGDIGLRADIWESALDIYAQSPIIGVGLGNFSVAYERLPAVVADGAQRRLLHQSELLVPPHANNLALTVLAEQGLVGLVALLALFVPGVVIARRLTCTSNSLGRATGIGLGAALLVMAAHSVLEASLFGEVALPLFAMLGLGASYLALSVQDNS